MMHDGFEDESLAIFDRWLMDWPTSSEETNQQRVSPVDYVDVETRVIPDRAPAITDERFQMEFTPVAAALDGTSIARVIMADLGTHERICEAHGPFQAKGTQLRTRTVWTTCPTCQADAAQSAFVKSRRVAEAAKRSELEGLLHQAAVPARFHGKTFDTFHAETPQQQKALESVRQYAENFEANQRIGAGLVLAGPPGTGKSHLAMAALQYVMPKYCGHYTTALSVIRAVRNTWRKDSEQGELEVLRDLTRAPLLVIDEIGASYGSDGEATILFDLLDRRYRDMKPSILLTNQNADGLKACLGERTFDRLTETSTWVPCQWASYRRMAREVT